MGARFERAVAITLKHEGGYVFDPRDAGGETRYGISKRAYPAIDIKNLTVEQAKAIYEKDYWNKGGYDRIKDDTLAFKVFDISVNTGIGTANKLVRRAMGAGESTSYLDEGIISKINKSNPSQVYNAFVNEAEKYYRSLKSFGTFGKGWLKRLGGQTAIAGIGILGFVLVAFGAWYVWREYGSTKR